MLSEEEEEGRATDDECMPETEGVSLPSNSSSSHNRNPTGKNQYKNGVSRAELGPHLLNYHNRGITNKNMIVKLLWADHKIKVSSRTVTRARKDFGLKASGATTRSLDDTVKQQLVLNQMSKDPRRNVGPRRMKEKIVKQTGIHLTRAHITEVMQMFDPEGFEHRHPTSKKPHRVPLAIPGPHFEWSLDGHDKLNKIGFPIYGIRDVWSTKWLGLWVVPNNRLKRVVAYLYLRLVRDLGGMPVQNTTDKGSETVTMYGLANALREYCSPDLALDELPAHKFLRSVENTTIERGWLRLRLEFGDNAVIEYTEGEHRYDANDPTQYKLVQWLWSRALQHELDMMRDGLNDHRIRLDHAKIHPSGVSPNIAMALPQDFGAEDYLQHIEDISVIERLMEEIGGEDLIRFVPEEFSTEAKAVFASVVGADTVLTLQNTWDVFDRMLPYM